jgi:hypothetical protein
VLHVDKGGIEAGQPDDLDDLRVGDPADMCAQRQAAFRSVSVLPDSLSCFPPVVGNHIGIGRRASARTIVRSRSYGRQQIRQGGGCKSTRLTFIDEPLRVFVVAFYLFSQFLDRFGSICYFVDQLFAGLGVALNELVQTFFGNVARARSCPPWALCLGKAGSFWLSPFEGGSYIRFRPRA